MPGGSLFQPTPSAKSLEDINLTAQGLISQNVDRSAAGSNSIMVAQRIFFMLVPLRAGQVATNISIVVTVIGVTMSLSKVGLYDVSGNRLGLSLDQGSAWESTGVKTIALTSAYTVPSDGGYYVAVLANGGTLPTLQALDTQGLVSAAIGTGALPFGLQSSQTDLPTTATITGTGSKAYWVGVS